MGSFSETVLSKSLLSPSEDAACVAITPLNSAFMIPIDQLEVGPVIAVGGQGQVRKGTFSGKAVACKELLASIFDPQETEALMVRPTVTITFI